MPVASQNSDKGLCRLAVTLVSGPRSPMSSGGTRYREEARVRVQMVVVCSLLPPHRPPQAFPTPSLKAAPTEGGEWWPQAGLWRQAEASVFPTPQRTARRIRQGPV